MQIKLAINNQLQSRKKKKKKSLTSSLENDLAWPRAMAIYANMMQYEMAMVTMSDWLARVNSSSMERSAI